jgi:hypothetical protein
MILVLKLLLTPILIAVATLAGRRWGPAFSGWFIGFPLTSAPVSFILALQHGPAFAAQSAVGILAGMVSVCIFCASYILISRKKNGWISASGGILAFLVSTAIWNLFSLSLLPTFAILIALIALLIWVIPQQAVSSKAITAPRWDLPARMILAMLFVVLLTSSASALGPQLSGLFAPFPLFAVILATFTHRQQGAGPARALLRGVILGGFAFSSFFLVAGEFLTRLPIGWTYSCASAAALLVNGLSLYLSNRKSKRLTRISR